MSAISEKGEVNLVGKEQSTSNRASMKAREINVAALGIGTDTDWQGHKIDKGTQRENSTEFVQSFAMFEERAAQCPGIVGNEIIRARCQGFNIIEEWMDKRPVVEQLHQLLPADRFIVLSPVKQIALSTMLRSTATPPPNSCLRSTVDTALRIYR